MSTQKPTFRVMKNGYDRFAVDDAIDQYAQQIEQLQKKLSLYQQQLVETTRTLEDMKQRYQQILTTEQSRQEAADNIARLSLREANEIISTAQKNADEIIVLTENGIAERGTHESLLEKNGTYAGYYNLSN